MKEKTFRTIKFLGLTLGIALSIFAISLAVYAWTAPTAAPPGDNVPAPINVGTTTQTKAGALGVGGVFTANTAVHLAVGGGNVGIGTTAPGARLTVSTSVVNEPGIMLIDDGGARIKTVAELGGGGYNPMSTPGAIGIIYHGSGGQNTGSLMIGQWSTSARGIKIDSTGNVGIGMTSPDARLHVDGTGRLLQLTSSGFGTLYAGSDVNAPWFGTATNHDLRIITNATEKMRITSGGNVGIGTTTPTARLDIEGQIRIRGGSPAAGRVLTSGADGTATWGTMTGLPTGISGQTLRHDGTNWVANSIIFNNGTNVGIGTTNPVHRLDIATGASNVKTYDFGLETTVNTTGGWARSKRFRNENNNVTSAFGALNEIAYIATGFNPAVDPTGHQSIRLSVLSNGNVGIGTTNPGARLEVRNNARFFDAAGNLVLIIE